MPSIDDLNNDLKKKDEDIFEIIKKIREEGTTILLVEQNAKIAIKLCDRGYVMNNGEITMSGSSPELENNEQIKEAYLGV